MKKYFICSILTLATLSCGKDDNNPNEQYKDFLNQSIPTFYGKIEETNFSWSFGRDFQMRGGYNVFGLFSETKPQISNTRINFYLLTPQYDYNSKNSIARTFSLGQKKIEANYSEDNFRLEIKIGNSNTMDAKGYWASTNPANEFKILKYVLNEKDSPYNLKVWFRIRAEFFVQNIYLPPFDVSTTILDGFMIAVFSFPE